MTSEDEICKFLKEAMKEEVKAASEYREWADKVTMVLPRDPGLAQGIRFALNEIADTQEGHSKILAEAKEDLCPGDDPDLSDLSEKAKAKLKEIWEAAKKRTKYEVELTSKCRLGAMSESKKAYDEFMRKCAVEKKIAPPP